MKELPPAFQADLSLETYQAMLLKVGTETSQVTSHVPTSLYQSELFQDIPKGCLRMLSTVVKPMLYLPNQVIINKGDMPQNLCFIHKGVVEVN